MSLVMTQSQAQLNRRGLPSETLKLWITRGRGIGGMGLKGLV
jgi:hypothetical protein